MFNFIYSEVWWMETIIAAAIIGASTLLSSVLVCEYKIKKMAHTLLRTKALLNNGNTEVSNDANGLSVEQQKIIDKQNEMLYFETTVLDKLTNINNLLVQKQNEEQHQFRLLSANHQQLTENVNDEISAYRVIMQELGELNKQLAYTAQQLEASQAEGNTLRAALGEKSAQYAALDNRYQTLLAQQREKPFEPMEP